MNQKETKMRRLKEDADLFYKLWLPLLSYVNQKNKIYRESQLLLKPNALDHQKLKIIADKLWEDVSVIDEYLVKIKDALPEEHRLIIRSWKRRVSGEFILERHLKKGSMFIYIENNEVYQVSGITSSWDEMFGYRPLPVIMKATLIPFKDVIISDGLVMPYDILVGPHISAEMKRTYLDAKNLGVIHKRL